jgi:hypothetical protein
MGLENRGEIWCGIVQDWRVEEKLDETLYRMENKFEVGCSTEKVWRVQVRCSVVWHSKSMQIRNKFSIPKRVVNRS